MFEPTEEQRRAYFEALFSSSLTVSRLADLAQHAIAAALEAEHIQDCSADCVLPHKKADWLRLADEKLREVKR